VKVGKSGWEHLAGRLIYPLVNIQKTMERSTIFNGKTHYEWPCSIAFRMFTRGEVIDLFSGKMMGTSTSTIAIKQWEHRTWGILTGKSSN
jgi:hypothetical protein